jgi:hypothetical protein
VRRFLATPERYSRIDEPGLRFAGIVDFSLGHEDLDAHRLSLQEKKITRLGLLLVGLQYFLDQNGTLRGGRGAHRILRPTMRDRGGCLRWYQEGWVSRVLNGRNIR